MKKNNLDEMTNGWFIGDFSPSIFRSEHFEVAIKRYDAGTIENKHLHKKAIEFTVVIKGIISINGIKFYEGDIITIYKNEEVEFIALIDAVTCVVKAPSVQNDKYFS